MERPWRFNAQTVGECFDIAQEEANRYQQQLENRDHAATGDKWTQQEHMRLMAKRNAASRIAQLILYGHTQGEEPEDFSQSEG